MTGRNSLHYCYDVSYQCWFASEEAKIYCNNFNSSNAIVCSHLILAYTVRFAIINAAELERNGCFSLPLFRNVALWLKGTSTESLQIELVTKYDTNDAQKESLVGGSKSANGGPRLLTDMDGWVQIRCDTSAKCPWFLIMSSSSFRSVLAVPSVVLDETVLSTVLTEAANSVVLVEVIWSNGLFGGRGRITIELAAAIFKMVRQEQWPLCMWLRGAIVNKVFFSSGWIDL